MGSQKGIGAKALTLPPDESQNHSDFSTLSTIDKVSFLEGLQKNDDGEFLHCNRLHSTALEEDLHVLEEGQVEEGKPVRKTLKTSAKQCSSAVKRKQPEMHKDIYTEKEKWHRRSTVENSGGPVPTADSHKKLVGKKPAKRRGAGQKSPARPVKNEKKRKSNSGKYSDSQSQEEYEFGIAQQKHRKVLSSEEDMDEETSWNPSPQKAKVYSRTRTSSSEAERARKNGRGHQGRTDLEVVLDAFLDFCEQYRESVESKAVKKSIDIFSNNVKEQLLEKISSYKELSVLKRQNAKVGSLIHKNTQRLLDAKNKLMRAERQVWLLQKEKAELQFRLADLRRGHAFLGDIKELNRQYLEYRDKHPKEKETYGVSSLPALLLETKHIQARAPTERNK